MAVVTIPAAFRSATQSFGVQRFDMEFSAGDTGASQTAVLGPPRLTCNLSSIERMDPAQAAIWRSIVMGLEGRVNKLAVHHFRQPQPLGTARGVWTAAVPAAAGATQLTVNVAGGVEGATVLQGDWFGVNQGLTNRQLLHVQEDAQIGGGLLVLKFRHALRIAVAAGSPIVWDKPTALFKQVGTSNSWTTYPSPRVGGHQGGFSLDLIEAWE